VVVEEWLAELPEKTMVYLLAFGLKFLLQIQTGKILLLQSFCVLFVPLLKQLLSAAKATAF